MQNLMPGYDAEEVSRRVNAFWEFRLGFIPWPRQTLSCTCGSEDLQVQHVGFASHKSTIPWRANINYKCCVCSRLWVHGIPISEAAYDLGIEHGRQLDWRDVQTLLAEG